MQKRLVKPTNSVIINYRCKLNQDFTYARLSRHRLLSEYRSNARHAVETQMYATRKHVRNDENACSRMQMDIRTCEMSMLKSTHYYERNDDMPKRRTNFRRQQMCCFRGTRKLYSKIICFNCHNICTREEKKL